jgi:polyisoprenoid-binding protein YceI
VDIMTTRVFFLSVFAVLAVLGADSAAVAEAKAKSKPAALQAPAGVYSLDRNHASLLIRVNHFGLSRYTIAFTDFTAELNFDPANLAKSSVTATINPKSVVTHYPGDYKAGHADSKYSTWDDDLANNPAWLDSGTHSTVSFASTSLVMTGPRTAKMTGDLTLRGIKQSIVLDVTLNGDAKFPWLGGRSSLGFSAKGKFDRTKFGMANLVPAVAADVEVVIEAEFLQKQ